MKVGGTLGSCSLKSALDRGTRACPALGMRSATCSGCLIDPGRQAARQQLPVVSKVWTCPVSRSRCAEPAASHQSLCCLGRPSWEDPGGPRVTPCRLPPRPGVAWGVSVARGTRKASGVSAEDVPSHPPTPVGAGASRGRGAGWRRRGAGPRATYGQTNTSGHSAL